VLPCPALLGWLECSFHKISLECTRLQQPPANSSRHFKTKIRALHHATMGS
jgi:hypothetical protein